MSQSSSASFSGFSNFVSICFPSRTEEAYNILTNLSDELTTDIRISEGKFEAVLDKACKNYAKKELNIESANKNV